MTTHQDNAARLARIAQIFAVVIILAAVATFIIPVPSNKITTGARNRNNPANPEGGDPGSKPRFKVPVEDWTIALGPLRASRDPIIDEGGAANGGPLAGANNGENGVDAKQEPDQANPAQRPPIRYFGSLADKKGMAALIDFAGKQRLLRVGQEFEDDFEITDITEDAITVTDGFREYTFDLAQPKLAEAPPNPLINQNRRNPTIPPGRTAPGQPQRPGDRKPNPRRPTPQNDDDGGSPA